MTTTHSMDATLECSALLMTGTATLTTLPSRADMNVPTPTAASTHQALRGTGAGAAGGAGLGSSLEFVNGLPLSRGRRRCQVEQQQRLECHVDPPSRTREGGSTWH